MSVERGISTKYGLNQFPYNLHHHNGWAIKSEKSPRTSRFMIYFIVLDTMLKYSFHMKLLLDFQPYFHQFKVENYNSRVVFTKY